MQGCSAIVKASIKCFNSVCSIHRESLITEEGVALLPQKACSNDGGVKLFSVKLESELCESEQNVGVNLQHGGVCQICGSVLLRISS